MPKSKAFKDLKRSVRSTYLGKPVPSKYKSRYGSRYDPSEMDSITYAIARRREIKIE